MSEKLTITPIGYLRCGKSLKFNALHQPNESKSETNVLELLSGDIYQKALIDLAGFSRIWLIGWFHRNQAWRPQVLPPRGPAKRRGVFATRSPHRPNPLSLTPVQLLEIKKNKLILGPCDLIDGTPIFDIKPYIPAYDSFPDSKAGWIEEVDAHLKDPPTYQIVYSPLAQTQRQWLNENWSVDFSDRLQEILSRDPSPHRTRRIRTRRDNLFDIGCGAWYAVFSVNQTTINILHLKPAFALKFLVDPQRPVIPDKEAQLAFRAQWPECLD